MKLLILTQKIDKNDSVLGFFHAWVEQFAKHCEEVTVIALGVGDYDLPANVRVLSLGKESGVSRVKYLARFYRYIWNERAHYDTVFVHMNTIYVILGGPLWRLWSKKVALWFTHRNVDWKLRLAERGADIIFSASPDGFRLPSTKVHFMGHGIDTLFWGDTKHDAHDAFTILAIGRITPIKHCEVLINAGKLFHIQYAKPFKIIFLGGPVVDEDNAYFRSLRELVDKLGLTPYVSFAGSKTPLEIRDYLRTADVTVNMLPTGGMDKAVLESLAAGVSVLTSNHTFAALMGEYADTFVLSELHHKSHEELAKKLIGFANEGVPQDEVSVLGTRVKERYSHIALVGEIVKLLG